MTGKDAKKVAAFAAVGALACSLGALLAEPLLSLAGPAHLEAEGAASAALLFNPDLAERLRREKAGRGGVELALSWNNTRDLDLRCVEPSGEEISTENRESRTGGYLDVDQNDAPPFRQKPVEHIFWQPPHKAPTGTYQIIVEHRPLRAAEKDERPTEYVCAVRVQGDFKDSYLKTFTGQVVPGQKETAGTFLVEPPPVPGPTWGQRIRLAAGASAWAALLAISLSLALVLAQNYYLRRRLLVPRQALLVMAGGLLAGAVAGGTTQLLFGLAGELEGAKELARSSRAGALDEVSRFVGWLTLGGMLGVGMSLFIPNLPRGRAAAAGAAGGLVAAWAFLDLSREAGDRAARLAGSALLGLFIGLAIALVEAVFREAWLEVVFGPNEVRNVGLGRAPVTLGAAPGCTVYAAGAPPVALSYCFENGVVVCTDPATGRSDAVPPGDARDVGRLRVCTRAAGAAEPRPGTEEFSLALDGGAVLPLPDAARLTASDLRAAAVATPVAEVSRNPHNPSARGLKNLSASTWQATLRSGEVRAVGPGRSLQLAAGTRIDFGGARGTLQARAAARGRRLPRGATAAVAVAAAAALAALAVIDWDRRRAAAGGAAEAAPPPVARRERAVLRGHRDAVGSVAFSPDARWIASAGRDKRVLLWQVADLEGPPDRSRDVHPAHDLDQGGVTTDLAFSPDGKTLAGAGGGVIKLWSVADGRLLRTLGAPPAVYLRAAAFSPDRDCLAAGCLDGRIRCWRAEDGRPEGEFGEPGGPPVTQVGFTADGSTLITGAAGPGAGPTVSLWDVRARRLLRTLPPSDHLGLHATALSGTARFAAVSWCLAGSQDEDTGLLKPNLTDDFFMLYSAADGRRLLPLHSHVNCVTHAAFCPAAETLLASASSDRTVKLRRLPGGECLDTLKGHSKEVWCVAFSRDGRLLVTGGNDWTVRVWNVPPQVLAR